MIKATFAASLVHFPNPNAAKTIAAKIDYECAAFTCTLQMACVREVGTLVLTVAVATWLENCSETVCFGKLRYYFLEGVI